PEKVAELDALIQSHLEESGAVVPLPNPSFDPLKYDPSLEGTQLTKTRSRREPPSPPRRSVAGWRPVRHTAFEIIDGVLRIKCTGNDPHLERALESPLPIGRYQVTLQFSSQVDGRGQIFWGGQDAKPRYARDRSVGFDVAASDARQTCSAAVVASEPVTFLRIDPLQNRGTVQLHSIQIRDATGEVRWAWPQAADPGNPPSN
ncbi:MAG: hypothetical protein AAGJ83_07410, partial [Planctomycetota bacterium]